MPPQVSKATFVQALRELGHDPALYEGKRLSLAAMAELYELNQDSIIEAIDRRAMAAHYDYAADTIWVDALEAAHFYYCICSENAIFEGVGSGKWSDSDVNH